MNLPKFIYSRKIMSNYWISDASGGELSFDSQLSQESKDAYYIPGWIKLPVDSSR